MQNLIVWAKENPLYATLFAIFVLAQVVVAVTPEKFQKTPWFGIAVRICYRLSFLTHADQEGTLQIPIIAKSISLFGKTEEAEDPQASPAPVVVPAAQVVVPTEPPVPTPIKPAASDPDPSKTPPDAA